MAFVMFRARLGDARDEEYLRQVGYALVDLGRLADEVPASSARADRAMNTPKEKEDTSPVFERVDRIIYEEVSEN